MARMSGKRQVLSFFCVLIVLISFLGCGFSGFSHRTEFRDVAYQEYVDRVGSVELLFSEGDHFWCMEQDERDGWVRWTRMTIDRHNYERVVSKWSKLPHPPTLSSTEGYGKVRRTLGAPPVSWPKLNNAVPTWWHSHLPVESSNCWHITTLNRGMGWHLTYEDETSTLWLYTWNQQHWADSISE